MTNQAPISTERAEFQPLYSQVKALLLKRIGTGSWKPGEMLPNEIELAAEYKVSQGTVRKALLELEAEKMLVRKQGVGTFVARHSRDRSLFQFFRIVGLDDSKLTPTSTVISQRSARAQPSQASQLGIETGEQVHVILRVRSFDGKPAILERIYVPVAIMPDLLLEKGVEMGDEMYVIYQEQYNISIARVAERLRAIASYADEARYLEISLNTPLLEISRVAYDVNGRPVELRVSHCNTTKSRYVADIQ